MRVYELEGKRLRKVYDQVWGGDVTGLGCVRTVGSVADGRDRIVVGFGGKVGPSSCRLRVPGCGNGGEQECVDAGETGVSGQDAAIGRACLRRDIILLMESHEE